MFIHYTYRETDYRYREETLLYVHIKENEYKTSDIDRILFVFHFADLIYGRMYRVIEYIMPMSSHIRDVRMLRRRL